MSNTIPANSAADSRPSEASLALQWSEEQLAYLQQKGPILMCVGPDWMPMDGIDENGRHVGMAADFIAIMARRGRLDIRLVPTASWEESYALGQQRQCDIFSMVMATPARRAFMDFTDPYLEIPGVIATSVDVPYVADLVQVMGKPLGHMRGFAGIELLQLRYPGIVLEEVDSYEEGLLRVQTGELFGLVGNMISIGYALQRDKISDLKIAGRIGSDSRMSIATRNDEPLLGEIFQQLVASLTPEERQEVMNRWMAVRFEQGFDHRLFWRTVAAFTLIAAAGLYWASTLRRLNRKLQRANQRLSELSRRDPLTGLYNRMHFDEMIASTVRLCGRHRLVMTLAMVDLDRFKEINDTFGHPFGDACLRRVAATLAEAFRRETDTAIRYGGEELVVVSVGGTTEDIVRQLEGFRRRVQESPVELDGQQAQLTVSIGVWSAVPEVGEDPLVPLREADAALYRAKSGGRNTLVLQQPRPPSPALPQGS